MWTIVFYAASILTQSSHASLSNLRQDVHHTTIPFPPNALNIIDISLLILLLIFRSFTSGSNATSAKLPTKSKKQVPNTLKLTTVDDVDPLALPPLSLSMPLRVGERDVEQYMACLKPPIKAKTKAAASLPAHEARSFLKNNPHHLPLFLSAISEPAMLLLLASYNCPIKPVGSVNVRNRFEVLDSSVAARIVTEPDSQFSVLAALPSKAKKVKRGREIDVVVSILHHAPSAGNAPHMDKEQGGREIFRQIFTMLEWGKSGSSGSSTSSSSTSSSKAVSAPAAKSSSTLHAVPASELRNAPILASYLTVPSDFPKTWARMCKDYNLIHLSGLAARMFGFSGIIAHGNHVAAMSLESLIQAGTVSSSGASTGSPATSATADEGIIGGDHSGAYMEIDFLRPVKLPDEIGVRVLETSPKKGKKGTGREHGSRSESKSVLGSEFAFEVFTGEKVLVEVRAGVL